MSNEKPVELTEEETRIALILFDCCATRSLAEAEDDMREVVAAREAAARREAEDDPAHARMYRALVERAERAEARVARVEALVDPDRSFPGPLGDSQIKSVLRAALAEPERDEEGGR